MRFLTPVLILTLSAGAAFAEQCTFTTECFEGDGCSDTNFSMEVTSESLITDAETITVSRGGPDTSNALVGYTASAIHVLTRTESSDARYTTHIFDGPLMVNYLGTCE